MGGLIEKARTVLSKDLERLGQVSLRQSIVIEVERQEMMISESVEDDGGAKSELEVTY